MILFLLAGLQITDLVTGCIVHLVKYKDFTSTKMKDGCLKKVAILFIGIAAMIVSTYFPEYEHLEFIVSPFIVSEITSLMETYNELKEDK